uniref:pyruvate kinase n=1 Tax=Lactuca sativa TaxID=4236 RepID=A0A9R1X0X1_LACSA|nr:hypothetical protein LSAT_V11C700348590 [Lactuca sativa]
MSHGDHASHETGKNVAHLNVSHGDHASHQNTIDIVKEYNAQFNEKVIAIMLDTKGLEVRSGDVAKPILLRVSTNNILSVNYDGFINDVEPGDILLVDGKITSFPLLKKIQLKKFIKCYIDICWISV